MSEPDDTAIDPDKWVVVERVVFQSMQDQSSGWRYATRLALIIGAVAVVILAGFGVYDRVVATDDRSDVKADVSNFGDRLTDAEKVLDRVETYLSADAEAQRAESVNGIIFKVDCNGAARLQALVDGLVANDVIEPGSIDVTANC